MNDLMLTDEKIMGIAGSKFHLQVGEKSRLMTIEESKSHLLIKCKAVSLATVEKVEPLVRKDEREKADKILVKMVKEIRATMWGDDWGIKSVIYPIELARILLEYRNALKATVEKEVK